MLVLWARHKWLMCSDVSISQVIYADHPSPRALRTSKAISSVQVLSAPVEPRSFGHVLFEIVMSTNRLFSVPSYIRTPKTSKHLQALYIRVPENLSGLSQYDEVPRTGNDLPSICTVGTSGSCSIFIPSQNTPSPRFTLHLPIESITNATDGPSSWIIPP